MDEHRIRITRTSGMNPWRAGCGESRTSGSEGGPGKPTSRETGRAPRSDPYSEHPTGEGKLYLCAVKDVFSNRIVGYSMDAQMPAALAVDALKNALVTRDVATTIVHSDRGSQFRSRAFVRALKEAELRGSMGRVGTCADNAAMESFFALLQKNVLNSQRWKTREELRLAIATWIERTYNRRRRQRGLGRLTPVEYETIYRVAKAA
jgi:putative transposase